jgi:type IV pilus assembly protein PilB
MERQQKRLGEILMAKGLITNEQLNDALDEQKKTKEFLGTILIKREWIKENDLLRALSEQFQIPFMSLKDKYIDWEFVKEFSPSLILDYKCIPIKKDDWSVTVAINNPLEAWVLQKAEEEARGLKVKFILALQEDINEIIQRYQQYMRGNITRFFK